MNIIKIFRLCLPLFALSCVLRAQPFVYADTVMMTRDYHIELSQTLGNTIMFKTTLKIKNFSSRFVCLAPEQISLRVNDSITLAPVDCHGLVVAPAYNEKTMLTFTLNGVTPRKIRLQIKKIGYSSARASVYDLGEMPNENGRRVAVEKIQVTVVEKKFATNGVNVKMRLNYTGGKLLTANYKNIQIITEHTKQFNEKSGAGAFHYDNRKGYENFELFFELPPEHVKVRSTLVFKDVFSEYELEPRPGFSHAFRLAPLFKELNADDIEEIK